MLNSQLQYPVEARIDIGFDAFRVEKVLQKVLTGYLLITQRGPIDRTGRRCAAFSIKHDDNHCKNLIHTLLVPVVWMLSAPQEQELRQQVLRLHLREVLKFLECPADILLDKLLHFPLMLRFLVFFNFHWGQRVEILVLLCDCDQAHASLKIGPFLAHGTSLLNPGEFGGFSASRGVDWQKAEENPPRERP